MTSRPPQLETPFGVFDEGLLTPNDAFYVRYHLAGLPTDDIDPDTYQLAVKGLVATPLSLSLAEIKAMPATEASRAGLNATNGPCRLRCPGGTTCRISGPVIEESQV